MGKPKSATGLILEAVRGAPGCHLEDMVMSCPELSWHAIFVEVTRLSRTGRLLVTSADPGGFLLDLPTRGKRPAPAATGAKDRGGSATGR